MGFNLVNVLDKIVFHGFCSGLDCREPCYKKKEATVTIIW